MKCAYSILEITLSIYFINMLRVIFMDDRFLDNEMVADVQDCREIKVSEDYADFITEYEIPSREVIMRFGAVCYQGIDVVYSAVYVPLNKVKELSITNYPYKSIPTLYGLMDTVALEDAGILKLQNQPVLNLKGQGTIIGIIDTGIDYTHKAFLDNVGNTRILKIWDQSDNSGNLPEAFGYGSEYSESDINKALRSENPLNIVPVTDEIGHGTFIAGVAGGSEDVENDFVGAAPECKLVIVKLKPAKRYLRAHYMLPEGVPAYQENDIMLALGYLRRQASMLGMPLSVVLGVGSNRGSHRGKSPLSSSIDDFTKKAASAIAIAGGNEGNKRHHFRGSVSERNDYENVEIRVGENEDGFLVEVWGNNPEIISVGFESPSGEVIPRIPARIGEKETIYTVFDNTVIDVEYALVEQLSGDELIFIRFRTPTAGVWKIRVYAENIIEGVFDVWLPISGFASNDVYFLQPEPDNTITAPGDTESAITVSSYSAQTGAFDPEASRGFLRSGDIKPELAAPGVGVMGPARDNRYTYRTGTSIAAAITAGAAAQILGWGLVNGDYQVLGNQIIKSYLIRGAKREEDIEYPSKEWGYGKLDVYNAFNLLR